MAMKARAWDRNAPLPHPEPIQLQLSERQDTALGVLKKLALIVGYVVAMIAYVVGTPLSWLVPAWPGRRTRSKKKSRG